MTPKSPVSHRISDGQLNCSSPFGVPCPPIRGAAFPVTTMMKTASSSPLDPQSETSLRRSRMAAAPLFGVLALGLFGLACSPEKSPGDEAQSDAAASSSAAGGQDMTAEAERGDPGEMVAGATEAGSDTAAAGGFSGGRQVLDTGVDLSELSTRNPMAEAPKPAYDPIADQNAVPGHLALAEGQSQVKDFGSLRQGDVGKHTFRLVSDGEAPLVITRLKPSCGCTVAEIALLGAEGERTIYRTGSEIEPGTEFEIVAELNTTGKSGAVSTQVAIYSNDPRAVFSLNLKADVQPVLLVSPSATMALGELTSVESASGEVRVSSESLDPFLLTVDDRYLEGQPVKVELTPVEPDAEGRSLTWDVAVEIGPDFPREGINNFPIVLNTDQEIENPKAPNPDGTPVYHQARVYAQATVLSLVSANPAFVSIGMLRPGEAMTKTVRLTTVDPDFTFPENPEIRIEGFRGTEFQYADNFELEILPVEGENALDLDIRLKGMPEGFSGSFGGLVVVEVGHPAKPEVQVRFSGLCRAGLKPAAPPAEAETKPSQEQDS